MQSRTSTSLAAALMLGAIAVVIRTTPDAHATLLHQPAAAMACTATVADTVAIAPAPVMVDAALSEAIGDSVSASFPAESKISVEQVAVAPDSATSLQLTLNTSQATPGEWTLSMQGTSGACTGSVKVADAKP